MNVDIKLIRDLYIKYIKRYPSGKIVSSGYQIREDYEKKTGNALTKGQYDNYVSKFDIEKLWEISRGNLPNRDTEDFGVDNNSVEGNYYSQRYIELSTETKHSPEDILLAHGYDPLLFEIVKSKSTGSKIGTKGNDEQYFINTYKSVEVKPKDTSELYKEDFIKLIKEEVEPLEQFEYVKKDTKTAYAIDFFDVHVNSSGYSREEMLKKVESARHYILNNNIEKVYIGFGGDFLHVNTTTKKTVAETQLTLVGTAYEMIREAEYLAKYIIERLCVVESEVFWVLGNHSDLPEYLLFGKVAQYYSDQEHIKFHVDESVYKAYVYGSQFVMLSHGDIKINEIRNIPSQRFPKLWSEAKSWEVHLGHYHQENVKTFGNLIVRYSRTPKATDEWEYSKGWWNALRHIQAYTIDYYDGIVGTHYL